MWTCPKCRESIADDFDVCWNCGTSRDGTEDPSFEPIASDAAVPDPGPGTEQDAGASAPPSFAPSDPTRQLVKVATFWHPVEAWLARNRLAEAGILAFVADEQLITANWLLSAAIGGAAVEIRLADLELAQAVLDEDASLDLKSTAASAPGPVCPQCGATELYRDRYRPSTASLGLLFLGIPIPIPSRTCRCCHCDWTGPTRARRRFPFRIADAAKWALLAAALLSMVKWLGLGPLKMALWLVLSIIIAMAMMGPVNHARHLSGVAWEYFGDVLDLTDVQR